MSRALRWMTFLAILAITAAGCGQDDGDTEGASPPATAPTTEAPAAQVDGIDFAGDSSVPLADGWTLSPCESGPPLFCARRYGETQATIEVRSTPVAGYDAMKAAIDAGRSPLDAMRTEAAEFVSIFEKDRPEGCGASYDVEPFGPEVATVGGRPGIVYGFDGNQSGRHVERALQFMTIDGATVHLIAVNAIADGTCMDDGELAEFTIDELTTLEPVLKKVVAVSTLP